MWSSPICTDRTLRAVIDQLKPARVASLYLHVKSCKSYIYILYFVDIQRSAPPIEMLWEQRVASSNLATPTRREDDVCQRIKRNLFAR